jgi:small subunit ribosomal protein S6
MTQQYELAVLFDPGLELDLAKATAKVEKLFADNKAVVANVDNWGKKKLAYPIKKHDSAIYVFYTLDMPGENLRKVETVLNITDEVIRFLLVKPDLKAIAKAEKMKAEKAEQAAKRGDREDKEDEE